MLSRLYVFKNAAAIPLDSGYYDVLVRASNREMPAAAGGVISKGASIGKTPGELSVHNEVYNRIITTGAATELIHNPTLRNFVDVGLRPRRYD